MPNDPQPDWAEEAINNDTTNVPDAPFTTEGVRFQMRRLPTNPAPGTDGITYCLWKTLDPQGKLLTTSAEETNEYWTVRR